MWREPLTNWLDYRDKLPFFSGCNKTSDCRINTHFHRSQQTPWSATMVSVSLGWGWGLVSASVGAESTLDEGVRWEMADGSSTANPRVLGIQPTSVLLQEFRRIWHLDKGAGFWAGPWRMVEFERNRDNLPNLLANKNICARYLRFIVYLKLKFNWPSQYFIQQHLKGEDV